MKGRTNGEIKKKRGSCFSDARRLTLTPRTGGGNTRLKLAYMILCFHPQREGEKQRMRDGVENREKD